VGSFDHGVTIEIGWSDSERELFKVFVNVINGSNKIFSPFMEGTASKDRTTSEEIGQLKVAMIIVDENLSSVPTELDVHEKSIHQMATSVHGLLLRTSDDLLNCSWSMNKDKVSRSSNLKIKNRLARFKTRVSNALEGNIKQWHSFLSLSILFHDHLTKVCFIKIGLFVVQKIVSLS
jgi:hypothetical protein